MDQEPSTPEHSSSSLDVIAEAIPKRPRQSELIQLPAFAGLLVKALRDRRDLPLSKAGLQLLDALLGSGQHQGLKPAGLVLYRCDERGVHVIDDRAETIDGSRYPSDREKALGLPINNPLRHYLSMGYSLADVPDGFSNHLGHPHPRYLAVEREKALQAFGLTGLFEGSAGHAHPPAVPDVRAADRPGATVQSAKQNERRDKGREAGKRPDWQPDEVQALVWLVQKAKSELKGRKGWWPRVIAVLETANNLGREVPSSQALLNVYKRGGGDQAKVNFAVVQSALSDWGIDLNANDANPKVRTAFDRIAA